ncbi:multidrug efflux protein, partial [Salmonella enterica subsp. enterica serovar Heidelberg str. N18440]
VGICMAVVTAIFTVTLRKHIALLYNDNPEVVALAAQLMLLAAVYQISDSIQVIVLQPFDVRLQTALHNLTLAPGSPSVREAADAAV